MISFPARELASQSTFRFSFHACSVHFDLRNSAFGIYKSLIYLVLKLIKGTFCHSICQTTCWKNFSRYLSPRSFRAKLETTQAP